MSPERNSDAVRALPADDVEQAILVAREVGPGLPAGEVREHLHARAEEAKLRGHFELALEPLPLALAEHRRPRVRVSHVGSRQGQSRGDALLGPGLVARAVQFHRQHRRPVVAQVRQDHLHALPGRAEHVRGIDAVPVAARRVRRARPRNRGRHGARRPSSGNRRRRRSRRSRGRPTSRRRASSRGAAVNPGCAASSAYLRFITAMSRVSA